MTARDRSHRLGNDNTNIFSCQTYSLTTLNHWKSLWALPCSASCHGLPCRPQPSPSLPLEILSSDLSPSYAPYDPPTSPPSPPSRETSRRGLRYRRYDERRTSARRPGRGCTDLQLQRDSAARYEPRRSQYWLGIVDRIHRLTWNSSFR
jgi:hypothetical protein